MRTIETSTRAGRTPRLLIALALLPTLALVALAPASASDCDQRCSQKTRLGIFSVFVTGLVDSRDIVAEADALGVDTVRFSQQVAAEPRADLAYFASQGKKVVLTIKNSPSPTQPPQTPEELATFKQQLKDLLDATPGAPIVQVENEELARNFTIGTNREYLDELEAAARIAHARELKVTNGGIINRVAALTTWQDLIDRGLDAKASDYAGRAFSREGDHAIRDQLLDPEFDGELNQATVQDQWDRGEAMLGGFRRSAIDWVNFHWYTDDSKALRQTIRFLERRTGKPAVTTELGQYDTNPDTVGTHLDAVVKRLRLPLVLWFDSDGDPAKALHDGPGGDLRPNGERFRDYAASHRRIIR